MALNTMDYSTDMITFGSVSKAKFFAKESPDWSIDGEYMQGCDIIEMEAISDAVKVIVPID